MDLNVLIKSLKMIASFPENHNMFGRPEDFIRIHSRNLSDLHDYINLNQDDFLHKIVLDIPPVSVQDISAYIEDKNSYKGWAQIFYAGYLFAAFKLFKLVKSGGQTTNDIEIKINTIASKSNSIMMILKNSQ